MTSQERRAMRLEQVERLASSGMGVGRWCELNGVGRTTMYAWMRRLRGEGALPAARGACAPAGWLELTRAEAAAASAIVPAAAAARGPAAPGQAHAAPIVVRAGRFAVEVPPGSDADDVARVLGAVASL